MHRYVYDGMRPAVRETHRYYFVTSDIDYLRADITRFTPTVPGGAGPVLYEDSDDTADVHVTDRDGRPWFWYRAREGKYLVPVDPRHPDRHPDGHFAYGSLRRDVGTEMRGTGVLRPMSLPAFPYMDFSPWHARVIEPDILMGRRGVAGWNGESCDVGLWVPALGPHTDIFSVLADYWWDIEWGKPVTWGYAAGGVVIVAAGAALVYYSGGMAMPLLAKAAGAGLIATGLVGGAVGAATHDPWKATGYGLTAGVGTFATVLLPGLAHRAVQATAPFFAEKGLGMYLLGVGARVGIQAAGGYLGGGAFGTTVGRLQGRSWQESLALGHRYGRIAAVAAGALSFAGEAFRILRYGRHLWTPGASGYRPPSLLKEIQRTFWEDRTTYHAAKQFRSRWGLTGRQVHGHHAVLKQQWYRGAQPIFARGGTPNRLMQHFGDAGINTLMLPARVHTLVHSGALASVGTTVAGYGVTAGAGWLSYKLGRMIGEPFWEAVLNE